MGSMHTKLLELFQDPLWWFTVVIVSFVVNLLSNFAYDMTERFLGNWYISRAGTRAIGRASFESKVSGLLTDPAFLRTLQVQARYELVTMILTPLMAFSSYKVAMLEHANIAANQGGLTVTVVYLLQSIAAIILFLVLVRTFIQRRRILSAIARMKARS